MCGLGQTIVLLTMFGVKSFSRAKIVGPKFAALCCAQRAVKVFVSPEIVAGSFCFTDEILFYTRLETC
jgi:hypothetical protein